MATTTMVGNPDIDDVSQDTDEAGGLVLKQATLIHTDGTRETAYIQDTGPGSAHHKRRKIHTHLSMVYIVIGSVALALTAIATVIQIKRNR